MAVRIISLVNHTDQLWFLSKDGNTKYKINSQSIKHLYSKLIKVVEPIELEKIPTFPNDSNKTIRKSYSGKILVSKNDLWKYWYVKPSELVRKELTFFDLLEIIYLMSIKMTAKQLELIADGIYED